MLKCSSQICLMSQYRFLHKTRYCASSYALHGNIHLHAYVSCKNCLGSPALPPTLMVWERQVGLKQTRHDCKQTTNSATAGGGEAGIYLKHWARVQRQRLAQPADCHSSTSSNEVCEAPRLNTSFIYGMNHNMRRPVDLGKECFAPCRLSLSVIFSSQALWGCYHFMTINCRALRCQVEIPVMILRCQHTPSAAVLCLSNACRPPTGFLTLPYCPRCSV